jgi:hypothetical protein
MKALLLIVSLLSFGLAQANIQCTGSCWSNGCCEPHHAPIPPSHPNPPHPPVCPPILDKEVCEKISVKEALSLHAAGTGVKVYLSGDQQSALRCN